MRIDLGLVSIFSYLLSWSTSYSSILDITSISLFFLKSTSLDLKLEPLDNALDLSLLPAIEAALLIEPLL